MSLPSLSEAAAIYTATLQVATNHSAPSPVSDPGSSSAFREYPELANVPPGPEYFRRRRELWLTPPATPPLPSTPSSSRAKLEAMLAKPGAIESEEVWKDGLRSIWKGLVSGGRLKRRLSLAIVTQVLRAGWIRDGTVPAGVKWTPLEESDGQTSKATDQTRS